MCSVTTRRSPNWPPSPAASPTVTSPSSRSRSTPPPERTVPPGSPQGPGGPRSRLGGQLVDLGHRVTGLLVYALDGLLARPGRQAEGFALLSVEPGPLEV